jgi:uncharacterized radical SAM superfamily protein
MSEEKAIKEVERFLEATSRYSKEDTVRGLYCHLNSQKARCRALAARVAELEAQAKELERERDDAEAALLAWIMEDYGSVALWHLHQAMRGRWDDLVMRLHEKASRLWADITPAPSGPPP